MPLNRTCEKIEGNDVVAGEETMGDTCDHGWLVQKAATVCSDGLKRFNELSWQVHVVVITFFPFELGLTLICFMLVFFVFVCRPLDLGCSSYGDRTYVSGAYAR